MRSGPNTNSARTCGRSASQGANSLGLAMRALFYVGFVPLAGLLIVRSMIETRGRVLID